MEEEYKLPVSLPKTTVKLINMKNDDIPIDEDSYWEAFDLFGSEYVCRLLGKHHYMVIFQRIWRVQLVLKR